MHLYLLHGKGGSPNGSVLQLESELRPKLPNAEFTRLLLPHSDPNVPAERSVEFLRSQNLSPNATVVGISLGGLVAAKLQESGREDLRVICVSSPTWADAVRLERKMPNRIALYGTHDDVIRGRTAEWPALAEAHAVDWLTHDTDRHKARIAELLLRWIAP
ncbi:MAG: alpha/beta hydrolase [Acidobacteriales bacterium]|nr:alpha/beta hydrolase [Terriglobales bacterium]